MKRIIKYIIVVAIIGAIAIVFYNKIYVPKSTFKVVHPVVGDLNVSVKGIGNVSAKSIYTISAQTGGKILSLHTDEGQWVKKGQLLVVMDGVDLPEQLSVLNASLEKSKFEIKAAIDDLKAQQAKKELIQLTYKRMTELRNKQLVSQVDLDQSKADLNNINALISAASAHIASAKAAKKVIQKEQDALNIKLNRLRVYAPIDGYVISKGAEVAQNVLPTNPIFKIVDTENLWVQTKVDERISSVIKVGQKAKITLRSQPNHIFNGTVKKINAMSDAVTLEREVDVRFNQLPKPFYINEQAEVVIAVKQYQNIVKVPVNTVVQHSGKSGIWVVKDSRAHFQEIEIINQNNKEVGVKNLTSKDQVLVPSLTKKSLSDGMKVWL